MALTKAEDARKLSDDELQAEILQAKQELFQLRLQQTVGKLEKPHEFRHTKRWIAQLLTVQTERAKSIRVNSQKTTQAEE
jgi:large subunit ribosomal protein L29